MLLTSTPLGRPGPDGLPFLACRRRPDPWESPAHRRASPGMVEGVGRAQLGGGDPNTVRRTLQQQAEESRA